MFVQRKTPKIFFFWTKAENGGWIKPVGSLNQEKCPTWGECHQDHHEGWKPGWDWLRSYSLYSGCRGWLGVTRNKRRHNFSASSILSSFTLALSHQQSEIHCTRTTNCTSNVERTKVIKSIFGQNLTSSWGSFRHQSMDGWIPKNWNKNNNEKRRRKKDG